MQANPALLQERRGALMVLRLNRPEAAHALDEALAAELARAAARCDADETVRAVVLTASGRFFCAGGDVKAMAAFGEAAGLRVKQLADDAHRAIASFARMRAPLIVAVNGVAAGGGFGLALCGDLVLAAQSARFVMAYTQAGLSPDGSTTWFLPRLVGLRRAQELAFTNRQLDANEALQWGLVTRVVPDAQLEAEALALGEQLARGPLGSHGAIKQLLHASWGNGLETQMEIEGRQIAACAASADGQEGLAAWRDKRAPRFR